MTPIAGLAFDALTKFIEPRLDDAAEFDFMRRSHCQATAREFMRDFQNCEESNTRKWKR